MKKTFLLLLFTSINFLSAQEFISPYVLVHKPDLTTLIQYIKTDDTKVLEDFAMQNPPVDTLWIESDTNKLPKDGWVYLLSAVVDLNVYTSLVNTQNIDVVNINKKCVKLFDDIKNKEIQDAIIYNSDGKKVLYKRKNAWYEVKKFNNENNINLIKLPDGTLFVFEIYKEYRRKYSIRNYYDFLYFKISSLFDRDPYDNKISSQYFAIDKPVYRHGDTLKLSAKFTDLKERIVNKPLILELSYFDKKTQKYKVQNIREINPNKYGSYYSSIYMHDSLPNEFKLR